MNHTIRVAFCGVLAGLGLALMFLTALLPMATFALPALAGLLMIMIVIEMGARWAWPTFAVVAILSVFFVPDKQAALLYVIFFGYYPILKALIERLKNKYPYINSLEEIAQNKEIPIYEAFQGTVIDNKLTILSPNKEFYLELLVESTKTPLINDSANIMLLKFFESVAQYVKNLIETWSSEKLRENVSTSAENEMSVVIYGEINDNFLLTGDAGIRALDKSITYSENIGKVLKDNVGFIQVPHHGGRHNISPSILNRLIGDVVEEGETTGKTAFVSVANSSDHPLQMVVNAFTRRGVRVYQTKGNIIHHHRDMPNRLGWTTLEPLGFEQKVEAWDD